MELGVRLVENIFDVLIGVERPASAANPPSATC
jgi:hypothetical protein